MTSSHAAAGPPNSRSASLQRPARKAFAAHKPGQRGLSTAWAVGFLLLHLPMAYLMRRIPLIAGAHAFLTFAFGLTLALRGRPPFMLAPWAAYVVGAEVLWRMCLAPIPWEFAKYSISLVCLVSLARSWGLRGSWLPAIYFALLVPASLLTFVQLSFEVARQQVSFSISGPICLAICASFFASVRLASSEFMRVVLAVLGPILGVAFLATFSLLTTTAAFGTASNFTGSGGYGPNQVSAMLALGAILATFFYLGGRTSALLKGIVLSSALWLLAQSALTFSRTGLYLFGAAMGPAAVFLSRAKGKGARLLLFLAILGAGTCAIAPILDAFTGGKLSQRFADKGLTGRDTIALLDLRVFQEHPVLGAGTGMSMFYRAQMGDAHAAHTEYTRLLADHGILGAGALIILLLMCGQAFWHARGPWAKAVVAALAIWALLFMAGTGMRLAAPAFLLGLIHARLMPEALARARLGKAAVRSIPFPPRRVARVAPDLAARRHLIPD